MNKSTPDDPEILAISLVYSALQSLDPEAQQRVITYVAQKLNLRNDVSMSFRSGQHLRNTTTESAREEPDAIDTEVSPTKDQLEGISPIAGRWMNRNGLTAESLSKIFSLGVDEIDLVAKKVPGQGKRGKMKSVFLLKGIAAYLSGGAPRFTHEQIKEACLHYDAFDTSNFAAYLKAFAAEISGSRESGYTLTARGLTEATDLIKEMIASNK